MHIQKSGFGLQLHFEYSVIVSFSEVMNLFWMISNFSKLVPKMDADADGFIEEKELREHINFMQKRSA